MEYGSGAAALLQARRSPRTHSAAAASQEERDRRCLQDIQSQEKSLLRACEGLQKQADVLSAALHEMRRSKRVRMDTPMAEAKQQELDLKQRLLKENAHTLRTLRGLRCELEMALSGKKLQALVSSTRERMQEVSGRDPTQVLQEVSAEEQRLQDQEQLLEEALQVEMDKEGAGRQNGNEAGACLRAGPWTAALQVV